MESITILYDNKAVEGFTADWGFSALIETDEETLLFDTGAKPEILKENGEKAGVDWQSINFIFISHNHWDHTGGLPFILQVTNQPELVVPETDLEYFEELAGEKAICVPVNAPTYISEKFISTGIMATGMENPAAEHSLIFQSSKGFILITGCSHPGIVEIAERATTICGEKLLLTIGGFHLYKKDAAEIEEIAQQLKNFTEYVAPCHCTGDSGIEIFKTLWKERFVEAKAGVEIPLQEA